MSLTLYTVLDWSKLGLTGIDGKLPFLSRSPSYDIVLTAPVAGHVESKYNIKTGRWSEPKFVADPYLRVHGLAPGLNYGAYPAQKTC